MDDTCTVLGCDIVAGDYAECTFAGIDPGEKLLVVDADEVKTLDLSDDFVGDELVALRVAVEGEFLGFGIEERTHESVGCDNCDGFAGIWIVGADDVVGDVRAYGKCGVGGKGPRSSGPCEEVGSSPLEEEFAVGSERGILIVEDAELGDASGVLHVAVTSGLV